MSMNEDDTRANLIDPKLANAGWGAIEGSMIRREQITQGRIQGGGKRGSSLSSDYVLVYRGRKLAILTGLNPALFTNIGYLVSAACWVLGFGIFFALHVRILSSPRPDGKPG